MGKNFSVGMTLGLGICALAVSASVPMNANGTIQVQKKVAKYKEGEILIKTASRSTRVPDAVAATLVEAGAEDRGSLTFWPQIRKLQLRGNVAMEDALAKLRSNRDILVAEPNYIYSINATLEAPGATSMDKKFKNQWALHNTGQKMEWNNKKIKGVKGADIKMSEVWAAHPEYSTAAADVIVAVIDTGIDSSHDQLHDNIWKNAGEMGAWHGVSPTASAGCKDKSCNGLDDDGNGLVDDYQGWNWALFTPQGEPLPGNNKSMDDNSHGSHCSGIIGARHDKDGTRGINGKVQLMALKFLDKDGSGTLEGGVEAIGYAINKHADVINASWGGPGSSDILDEAISVATDEGILFVAAAGNDSMDNDMNETFPANSADALSVVSTDNRDLMSDFSNYGRKKAHISAPGQMILSTVLKGGYEYYSGTSMAAPHVSGVAALTIATHPEFKHHPRELKAYLMNTSDISRNLVTRSVSGGRLNAYNAVNGILPAGHARPDHESWSPMVAKVLESEHPYKTGSKTEFTITQPGAKWIRVKFGRHSVEWEQDYVEVQDAQGNLVDAITGLGLEATTSAVKGDTVKLVLKTDGNVNGWGFEVLGYEYMN